MKGSFAPFSERKENEKNILAFLFLNFIRALVVPITPFLPVGNNLNPCIFVDRIRMKNIGEEKNRRKISS
jgi:hypothetical protein